MFELERERLADLQQAWNDLDLGTGRWSFLPKKIAEMRVLYANLDLCCQQVEQSESAESNDEKVALLAEYSDLKTELNDAINEETNFLFTQITAFSNTRSSISENLRLIQQLSLIFPSGSDERKKIQSRLEDQLNENIAGISSVMSNSNTIPLNLNVLESYIRTVQTFLPYVSENTCQQVNAMSLKMASRLDKTDARIKAQLDACDNIIVQITAGMNGFISFSHDMASFEAGFAAQQANVRFAAALLPFSLVDETKNAFNQALTDFKGFYSAQQSGTTGLTAPGFTYFRSPPAVNAIQAYCDAFRDLEYQVDAKADFDTVNWTSDLPEETIKISDTRLETIGGDVALMIEIFCRAISAIPAIDQPKEILIWGPEAQKINDEFQKTAFAASIAVKIVPSATAVAQSQETTPPSSLLSSLSTPSNVKPSSESTKVVSTSPLPPPVFPLPGAGVGLDPGERPAKKFPWSFGKGQ